MIDVKLLKKSKGGSAPVGSGINTGGSSDLWRLQSLLDSKLDKSVFDDMFELVTENGVTSIHAKYGLWTNDFLSARGVNPDASPVKSGIDEKELALYLATNQYAKLSDIPSLEDYALKSEIPSLTGYATESWVEGKNYLTSHQSLDGYATQTWVEGKGYLTSHQTLYALKFQSGSFAAKTYTPNSATQTVNIPTKTSHLTNDSDFATNATLTAGLALKLDKSVFDELFEKVNIGTDEEPVWAIKAKYGLYTEEFLSARGLDPDASDAPIGLDWEGIEKELIANGYATQTWVENKGYLTSVAWGDVTGKPSWIGSTKPSYAFSEITSKPTTLGGYGITDALKIDGTNGTQAGVSALIRKLTEATADVTDETMFVTSNVAPSDTNNLFYRRSATKLWNYLKGKSDGIYLPLTGGTLSGALSLQFDVDTSRAKGYSWKDTSGTVVGQVLMHNTAKGIIINSTGAKDIWSDKVGNYSLYVGENKLTYNGYSILHTNNYASTLDTRYVKKSGDTMTGTLTVPQLNIVGSASSDAILTADNAKNVYFQVGSRVSLVINDTEACVRPGNSYNNVFALGKTAARWSNVYSVLGNFSGLITASAGIKIGDCTITYDSTNKALKFSTGIYSESFVSAKGANSAGSSGGVSYDRLNDWADYSSDKSGYVLSAKLGYDLYLNKLNATKAAIEGLLTGNISTHTHSQYLSSITKAQVEAVLTGNITSHTHSYLPLAGGTMTGVLNLSYNTASATDPAKGLHIKDSSNNGLAHIGYSTMLGIYSAGTIALRPNQDLDSVDVTKGLSISSNDLTYNGYSVLNTNNYAATLDTRYVKKSGDTMTGNLTVPRLNVTGSASGDGYIYSDAVHNIYLVSNGKAGLVVNGETNQVRPGLGHGNVFSLGSSESVWKEVYGRDYKSDTTLYVSSAAGTSVIFRVGAAEKGRFLGSNGYFGIATTTPAYTLDVAGTARVTKLMIGGITLEEVNGNLHINKGIYSDSFVSARGANSSGSNGGSSYNRLDAWSDYATSKDGYVLSAKLGYDLYSNKADKIALSKYLPLEGGTMTGALVFSGSTTDIIKVFSTGTYACINFKAKEANSFSLGSLSSDGFYLWSKATNDHIIDVSKEGIITSNCATRGSLILKGATDGNFMDFYAGTDRAAAVGVSKTGAFLQNIKSSTTQYLYLPNTGGIEYVSNSTHNTLWHSGNDGSGSGLDADLLDGLHASSFARGGTASITVPAGVGRWVRIATSSSYNFSGIISIVNGYNNHPTSGVTIAVHGSYRNSTVLSITQLGGRAYYITKVRIVYPTASNDPYYIEVFTSDHTAGDNGVYMRLANSLNLSLVGTYTAGSIPSGYASKELTLTHGMSAETFLGSLSGNATTATTLATTRKLWGQDFNGGADVSGALSLVTNIGMSGNINATNANQSSDFGLIVTGKTYKVGFIVGASLTNRGIYDFTKSQYIIKGNASDNTILNLGNVGIGTESPAEKLQVNGNIAITNTLRSTTTLYLKSAASTSIIFNIGDTEVMRIWKPNGYVGILKSDPAYPLEVNGTARVTKLMIGGIMLEEVNGNLHINKGVYSDSFVSAKGANSSGSSGGSSYNRLDAWSDYATSKDGYVLSAKLGYDLYSNKADKSSLSHYLPLAGGTMTGALVFSGATTDIIKLTSTGTYACINFKAKEGNSYSIGSLSSGGFYLWSQATNGHVIDVSKEGIITSNCSTRGSLILKGATEGNFMDFYAGTERSAAVGVAKSGVFLQNLKSDNLQYLYLPNEGGIKFVSNSTHYNIWHSGNFTPGNYLPLAGGTMTGVLNLSYNTASATDPAKGLHIKDSSNNGLAHIGYSTMLGIYSAGTIALRPNQDLDNVDVTKGLSISSNDLTYNGYSVLNTNNYAATLDTRYVKKSGDTMTGNLTVPRLNVTGSASGDGYIYSDAVHNIYLVSNGKAGLVVNGETNQVRPGLGHGNVFSLGSSESVWKEVYGRDYKSDTTLYVSSAAGTSVIFRVGAAEKGRFLGSNGYFGIATTTPAYHLDVNGKIGVNDSIVSSKTTTTYLAGNQGQAIINSTAGAGTYTMLAKTNSTNGVFTFGSYQTRFELHYTSNDTVIAKTNTVTHNITLLDEDGITKVSKLKIGNITLEDVGGNLHINKGIYSDSFVSAKGANSSESSGGVSYNRLDNWSDYATSKDGYVLSAKLGYDLYSKLTSHTHIQYVTLDTEQTIKAVKNFDENIVFTAEKMIKAYEPRKKEGSTGWAYTPLTVRDLAGEAFAYFGVYGSANTLKYIYIGSNTYNVEKHLRISPDGEASAAKFIKFGGTSTQFLKADGSVDSNTYLTTSSASSTYVKKAGDTMTGNLTVPKINIVGSASSTAYLTADSAQNAYFSVNSKVMFVLNEEESCARPGNSYNNVFALGKTAARWSNVYSVLGNFSDKLTTNTLTISNTNAVAHIALSRGGYNYFTTPASGLFGFVANGKSVASDNCDLIVTDGMVQVGGVLHIRKDDAQNYTQGIRINQIGTISSVWLATSTESGYDAGMWGITASNNGNLRFRGGATAASDLMVITQGGNVGIGTTTPLEKLQVLGTTRTTKLVIGSTEATNHIAFSRGGANYITAPEAGSILFVPNGKTVGVANSTLVVTDNVLYPGTSHAVNLGDSTHVWERIYGRYIDTDSGYNLRLCTQGTERISVVAANGYVGINNTSPAYQLDVSGIIKTNALLKVACTTTQASYNQGIRLCGSAKDSTWSLVLFGCDPAVDTGTHGNQWLVGRNASNAFVVDKGGSSGENGFIITSDLKMGVGTANPSHKLHVSGSMKSSYLETGFIELYGATPYIDFHFGSSTSDYTTRIIEEASGKLKITGTLHVVTGMYSDGYVSAKGQSTSSDQRLKRNFNAFEIALHQIAFAPSVSFDWKDGSHDVGTIAQYWQKINPLLTPIGPDGYLTLQYGKTALLSVITVAKKVKSHEERITELERENKELKHKLEILERR